MVNSFAWIGLDVIVEGSGVTVGGEEGEVDIGCGGGEELGHEFAGDGAEAEAEHGVTCGDGEVGVLAAATDIGKAVRRHGAEAAPGGNASEVGGSEVGEIVGDCVDDALDSLGVDGFVHAGDFHGTAEAEGSAHGSDGDAGLGKDCGDRREVLGAGHGEAVAFAGLHGEADAEGTADGRRPTAAGDDVLVGFDGAGGSADGGDTARAGAAVRSELPVDGGGVPAKINAVVLDGGGECGDELHGGQVGVVGEEDAAENAGAEGGFEFGGVGGGEVFAGDTEGFAMGTELDFVVEGVLRLAEHEQASADEAEVVVAFACEFFITGTAGEVEVAEQRRGAFDVFGSAGTHEVDTPAEEVEAQAGFDVKGAARVPHHAQAGGDHARSGEWDEMARGDIAGVAERAAVAGGRVEVAFDQGDAVAGAAAEMGDGETDDAAADDEDVF